VSPLILTHFTSVNALGIGVAAILDALRDGRSGLTPCTFENVALKTWCGTVREADSHPIGGSLADYDGRNNRLAAQAMATDGFDEQVARARSRYGAARIGVFIGTSTSGILETEHAYQARDPVTGRLPTGFHLRETHNLFATTDFVRRSLGLAGPAATVSTACSSSAKVFASAWRMIELGLCDAAVVGGVDSLCRNTLYGFASLELVAPEPCRPCAADRNGISIGEAAGFALLERPAQADAHSGVALLGFGESSDAYHMSSPHPEGDGAVLAMQRALASSTKGWTGHTLGAAGITEAVISALCIQHGFMPGNLNTRTLDPSLTGNLLLANREQRVQRVLSNSFGFGGSNASLVLGAAT
jgi:3-oxoacyl-[acyl-carrier-protein] synthase-1